MGYSFDNAVGFHVNFIRALKDGTAEDVADMLARKGVARITKSELGEAIVGNDTGKFSLVFDAHVTDFAHLGDEWRTDEIRLLTARAIHNGNLSILTKLVEHPKFSFNDERLFDGLTAATKNDEIECFDYLAGKTDYGDKVHELFSIAVENNSLSIATKLAPGVSPNFFESGKSPFLYAVINGNDDMFEFMVGEFPEFAGDPLAIIAAASDENEEYVLRMIEFADMTEVGCVCSEKSNAETLAFIEEIAMRETRRCMEPGQRRERTGP